MDAGGKKSADEISAYADLRKLTAQREEFRKENWKILAENHEKVCSTSSTCNKQPKNTDGST